MNKPEKQTKSFYDYHQCSSFLEKKYGYNERDYAGNRKYEAEAKKSTDQKFGDSSWYSAIPVDMNPKQKEAYTFYQELMKSQPEYLNFWHWVVDHHDIHNGCEIVFSNEGYECIEEDWVKEIYKHYMDEFSGVENWETITDYVSVDLYVEW